MNRNILLGLSVLFLISLESQAKTTMPVVFEYQKASDLKLWKGVNQKSVPEELIQSVEIENPSHAFRPPYEEVFFQDERVVICVDSCDLPQNLRPQKRGEDYVIAPSTSFLNRAKRNSIIRQTTLYYWLDAFFDRMEVLGFRPEQRLIVRVDRDVIDAITGLDFSNNAFFNDRDWTLSFLPSESILINRVLGVNYRPSGYDSSVAMHEAGHAVFQQLIGSIVNQELYGLHEAFADYFSISILDSSEIGLIMGSGKSLRSGKEILKYKAGMEAHDLGNVVMSALYNIRLLFSDKLLADKIALETVRQVSKNPFANAGDVMAAYEKAFFTLTNSVERYDEVLIENIRAIWTKTEMSPSPAPELPSKIVALGTLPEKSYIMSELSNVVPEWITREYGDKSKSVQFAVIEVVPTEDEKSKWVLFEILGDDGPRRYWTHFQKNEKGTVYKIVSTYNEKFRLVSKSDPVDFYNLLLLGDSLINMLNWTENYGLNITKMKLRGVDMSVMFKFAKREEISKSSFVINGLSIEGLVHKRQLKRTIFGKVIAAFGKEVRAMLKSMKEISFYTVATDALPKHEQTSSLSELTPGRTIVGYKLKMSTGLTQEFLIKEFKK